MELRIVSSFAERLKEALGDMPASALAAEIGLSKQAISMYMTGQRNPKRPTIEAIARRLGVNPAWLCGYDVPRTLSQVVPSDIPMSLVPVLGRISAGVPLYAEQNLEGYEYAPIKNGDEYFYLRVQGDSMKNANIQPGYKVLIKKQPCAENGQIVVCVVNGNDATLKRYREQQDVVVLQPENSDYEPIIVSKKDFDSGYAYIVGVAVQVQYNI